MRQVWAGFTVHTSVHTFCPTSCVLMLCLFAVHVADLFLNLEYIGFLLMAITAHVDMYMQTCTRHVDVVMATCTQHADMYMSRCIVRALHVHCM